MGNEKKIKEHPVTSMISNFATTAVLIPLSFFFEIIVVNYLGADGQGLFKFAIVIYGVFLPIIMIGFSAGLRYQISSFNYKVEDILSSVFLLWCIFSLIGMSIIFSLWYFSSFGKTGNQFDLPMIIALLCGIPLSIGTVLCSRILVGISEFVEKNKISVLFIIFKFCFVIVAIYLLNLGVLGILIAVNVAFLIQLIQFLQSILKRFPFKITLDKSFIKDSITYGSQLWLAEVLKLSNNRFDQLIIGFLLAPEALGIYSVAVTLAEFTMKIPQTVSQVFFNRIAAKSKEDAIVLLVRIHKALFYMTLIIALGILVFGKWLIYIMFGEEFNDAFAILLVYLPGIIFFMVARVFLQFFGASGMPMKNFIIQATGFLVSIPLYFILIKSMGVTGAALASSIAYITLYFAGYFIFRRYIKPQKINLFLPSKSDIDWFSQQLKLMFNKLGLST